MFTGTDIKHIAASIIEILFVFDVKRAPAENLVF